MFRNLFRNVAVPRYRLRRGCARGDRQLDPEERHAVRVTKGPVAGRRLGERTVRHVDWQPYGLTHDDGRRVRAGVANVGSRVAFVAALPDA